MQKILITAATINGKIAKSAFHNADWTSKQDKKFFLQESKKAGVIIFGSNTYEAMKRHLPGRLNIVMTRNPAKYKNQHKSNVLEFTSISPKILIKNLEKKRF